MSHVALSPRACVHVAYCVRAPRAHGACRASACARVCFVSACARDGEGVGGVPIIIPRVDDGLDGGGVGLEQPRHTDNVASSGGAVDHALQLDEGQGLEDSAQVALGRYVVHGLARSPRCTERTQVKCAHHALADELQLHEHEETRGCHDAAATALAVVRARSFVG